MNGRGDPTQRERTVEEIKAQRDLDRGDRDGVASMHDVEAETGDEQELRDRFTIDQVEAQDAGVALDPISAPEADLD